MWAFYFAIIELRDSSAKFSLQWELRERVQPAAGYIVIAVYHVYAYKENLRILEGSYDEKGENKQVWIQIQYVQGNCNISNTVPVSKQMETHYCTKLTITCLKPNISVEPSRFH